MLYAFLITNEILFFILGALANKHLNQYSQMSLYIDSATGDEVISDVHPIKEVDGLLCEVGCQNITISQATEEDTGPKFRIMQLRKRLLVNDSI